MDSFLYNGTPYLVVATGDGRIYILDENLNFARNSSREFIGDPDIPSGVHPASWQANRTLGQCTTFDLLQDPSGGNANIYFSEWTRPLYTKDDGAYADKEIHYRVGRLILPSTGSPSWDSYVQDSRSYRLATSPGDALLSSYATYHRGFRYADLDGLGTKAYHFQETGAAFLDPIAGAVRQFSNMAISPAALPIGKSVGGYVWQVNNLAAADYSLLNGFYVPRDPTVPYEDFGGNDWYYPIKGTRLTGQIASHTANAVTFEFGSSMKAVPLPDPSNPGFAPAWHLVTGTFGGYVYAIKPGANSSSPTIGSSLSYASNDLGESVIGMDAGNLDGDASDNEIAVGTWIDTGDRVDWVQGNVKRNRAHLSILKAQPTSRTFSEIYRLDGDDLVGAGAGIGSGLAGVKIDDVNADGVNEIWAGDAIGHIYLFSHIQKNPALGWACVYQSDDLGAYAGMYNNIFPIKDAAGHTVKLVVVSAGYIMAFDVNYQGF